VTAEVDTTGVLLRLNPAPVHLERDA
jgi:hypothetical protein